MKLILLHICFIIYYIVWSMMWEENVQKIPWLWYRTIDIELSVRKLQLGDNNSLLHDEIQGHKHASKDPLHIRVGPIIRSRAKRMQEALNGLIEDVRAKTLACQALEEHPHLVPSLHV